MDYCALHMTRRVEKGWGMSKPWALRLRGVVVAGLTLLATACNPVVAPSPTPGGGGVSAPPATTWVAGDSISTVTAWPGKLTPPLKTTAVPRTGFIRRIGGRTIRDNLRAAIDVDGVPDQVVIMGGVNDVRVSDPPSSAEIISAMADLEASLTARGIEVRWATEPAWTYADQLVPLKLWIRSQPNHIDCAGVIDSWWYTADGVHPTTAGYQLLADCIRARL